jgi:hypothetical protein
MAGRFALLPNARSELLTRTTPPAAGGMRRQVAVDVEIQADGTPQTPRIGVTGDLFGPGDVSSVNRAIVSRVEPQSGLRGFEPNYMPFVEFVDADFPWRYSLDSGDPDRLKPWIVLVALLAEEFEFVDGGTNALPRIRVKNPSTALPDLAQSWAFAHVQLSLAAAADTIAGVLQADPIHQFARLLCPRRLKERQAYSLFLVPAYEAGRLTGLASGQSASPYDAPAWNASSTQPIDLPVYYQSLFVTDSMEDVETQLKRLRPLTADEINAAGAPMQASAARPGYYPDYVKAGARFAVEGALRLPGAAETRLETDEALTNLVILTLNAGISSEGDSEDVTGPDPLVAFPPYGWRYHPDDAVVRSRALTGRWFDLINLDLKFRQVAGLGAETVRRNRELFAKRCWEQYEDVLEGNRWLARLKAAAALAQRVCDKHVVKLPSDTLVALAEPLQPYVKGATAAVIVDELRQHGTPSSFASRGLRRLSCKRSVRVAVPGRGTMRVVPAPAIPGDRRSDPVTAPLQRPNVARVNDTLLARQGLAQPIAQGLSSFLAPAKFSGVTRARRLGIRITAFDSTTWSANLADTLRKLPGIKAELTISGRLPPETGDIMPIYRSPVLDDPLADRLRDVAPASILTDASRVAIDTVSVFEENRRFIEAFLVGANHEMNKELRWREFPTDMRGTIFRRFWDRGRPAGDQSGDDITEIHSWDGLLGTHFVPGNIPADLVVVIRSPVVRKLDLPILVLNEAVGTQWQSGSGIDHEPIFFGKLGADIAYYGFDVSRDHILQVARDRVFLVVYEPAGRLRFGLDIATAEVRQQRQDVGQQSLAFPVRVLGRTENIVPVRKSPPGPVPPHPVRWDDFSWQHVMLLASGYIDFSLTITIPGQPDLWGTGKTSASLARSFWQEPVAVVLPLRRIFR